MDLANRKMESQNCGKKREGVKNVHGKREKGARERWFVVKHVSFQMDGWQSLDVICVERTIHITLLVRSHTPRDLGRFFFFSLKGSIVKLSQPYRVIIRMFKRSFDINLKHPNPKNSASSARSTQALEAWLWYDVVEIVWCLFLNIHQTLFWSDQNIPLFKSLKEMGTNQKTCWSMYKNRDFGIHWR